MSTSIPSKLSIHGVFLLPGRRRMLPHYLWHRRAGWWLVLLGLLVQSAAAQKPQSEAGTPELPAVAREFRAAWVATVANIDWPSRARLTSEQQQSEMLALLDCAVRLKLNAIVFQVRPSCDALYDSQLEPWSEYLTGTMGKAPDPLYDPLEFTVTEAHQRGIEVHAWFNPYRARDAGSKSAVSEDHIGRLKPEIVKQYGKYQWLDPGEPAATEHTLAVIRDVVQRYDVDGVHLDDYFYPYPINDDQGQRVEFPDDASWKRAQSAGTTLPRDDWRRENVNQLIRQIHEEIRQLKPWVKFGISPFGICRPGKPPQIQGFDQYTALYADAEKWFTEGWVDYLTPQLYWEIGPPAQSYSALLHWWHEHNVQQRHLWPGNFTSRLLASQARHWPAEEVIAQIWVTRAQTGATGNVHFSMKALQQDAEGIAQRLRTGAYRHPALVPASPWLEDPAAPEPAVPEFRVKNSSNGTVVELAGDQRPWLWVVRARYDSQWRTKILPGSERRCRLAPTPIRARQSAKPEAVAVSVVNRIGVESPLGWHEE